MPRLATLEIIKEVRPSDKGGITEKWSAPRP